MRVVLRLPSTICESQSPDPETTVSTVTALQSHQIPLFPKRMLPINNAVGNRLVRLTVVSSINQNQPFLLHDSNVPDFLKPPT